MKLWQQQKRGKEKLKQLAFLKAKTAPKKKLNLPAEIFREILKK
jgi:hypothetical protein